MTLNERELFEQLDKVSEILKDHEIEFSESDNQYYHSIYTTFVPEEIHFLNGAWFAWQKKAKAQAVPVWVSTDFMMPDEGDLVLFLDKNNIIHEGYLSTDYVDGPYGENGEDLGDDQTLWASNSNGEEFLLEEVKYWMHRPECPSASESGAEG